MIQPEIHISHDIECLYVVFDRFHLLTVLTNKCANDHKKLSLHQFTKSPLY
jgi:hypothetical protein